MKGLLQVRHVRDIAFRRGLGLRGGKGELLAIHFLGRLAGGRRGAELNRNKCRAGQAYPPHGVAVQHHPLPVAQPPHRLCTDKVCRYCACYAYAVCHAVLGVRLLLTECVVTTSIHRYLYDSVPARKLWCHCALCPVVPDSENVPDRDGIDTTDASTVVEIKLHSSLNLLSECSDTCVVIS